MHPTLHDVIDLAKCAGEIVRAGYGRTHHVLHKSAIDLVTEIDHQSEAYLVASIRARFPHHSITTEEAGDIEANGIASTVKQSPHCCWYIDPLDGTVNYSHGLQLFCVSVGYAEDGKLLLGAIYDPMHDECYSAEYGRGAFLNGEPIHVADTPDLAHSLLVTGFAYDLWERDTNLDNFIYFSKRTQAVRRLGSAALDLCFVAAGRLDGYWEINIKSYDIAAGALIVREAGGIATRINGSDSILIPPNDIVAANPVLHPQLLKHLQRG
jgi:myo-inositol-1(or 4)-monophosphatase